MLNRVQDGNSGEYQLAPNSDAGEACVKECARRPCSAIICAAAAMPALSVLKDEEFAGGVWQKCGGGRGARHRGRAPSRVASTTTHASRCPTSACRRSVRRSSASQRRVRPPVRHRASTNISQPARQRACPRSRKPPTVQRPRKVAVLNCRLITQSYAAPTCSSC